MEKNVEKDITLARKILETKKDFQNFRKVIIVANNSLRTYANLNLNGKDVLLKINALDQVFDLLMHGANVTCYSDNRLDEYFINLLHKLHELKTSTYMNYLLYDDKKRKIRFSKESYERIKDSLDEKTRYFFDELYSYSEKKQLPMDRLVEKNIYPKGALNQYIMHYLSNKFPLVRENESYEYSFLTDEDALTFFDGKQFDFIDLSYNLDEINMMQYYDIISDTSKYDEMLKKGGMMQTFVATDEIDVPNHEAFKTSSIMNSLPTVNEHIDDYSYMYKKSQ